MREANNGDSLGTLEGSAVGVEILFYLVWGAGRIEPWRCKQKQQQRKHNDDQIRSWLTPGHLHFRPAIPHTLSHTHTHTRPPTPPSPVVFSWCFRGVLPGTLVNVDHQSDSYGDSALCDMRYLRELDISNNTLHGPIPRCLGTSNLNLSHLLAGLNGGCAAPNRCSVNPECMAHDSSARVPSLAGRYVGPCISGSPCKCLQFQNLSDSSLICLSLFGYLSWWSAKLTFPPLFFW